MYTTRGYKLHMDYNINQLHSQILVTNSGVESPYPDPFVSRQ